MLPDDVAFMLDVQGEVIELTVTDSASSWTVSRMLYQRHLENHGFLDTIINDIGAEFVRNRNSPA